MPDPASVRVPRAYRRGYLDALRDAADEYRQPVIKVGTAPDMVRGWLKERADRFERDGVPRKATP